MAFYKRLIALPKSKKTFVEGSFEVLCWDGQLVCCQRVLAGERIIVTLNRGPEEWAGRTITVPTTRMKKGIRFEGYFSGLSLNAEDDCLTLPDLTKGGEIWLVAP